MDIRFRTISGTGLVGLELAEQDHFRARSRTGFENPCTFCRRQLVSPLARLLRMKRPMSKGVRVGGNPEFLPDSGKLRKGPTDHGEIRRREDQRRSSAQVQIMTNGEMGSETSRRRGGLEPSRKARLVTLVAYESGSVVSRTIIETGAGTVTLFAFDEGEGLSEHTAAYDALLYVLEGEAAVTISGAVNEMKEGECIVLPAGRPHSVRATTRFKMLLTMIRDQQNLHP